MISQRGAFPAGVGAYSFLGPYLPSDERIISFRRFMPRTGGNSLSSLEHVDPDLLAGSTLFT